MTRVEYIEKLFEVISEAMLHDEDMRREAIVDGRTGLDEMTDAELAEFGRDCWQLEWDVDTRP